VRKPPLPNPSFPYEDDSYSCFVTVSVGGDERGVVLCECGGCRGVGVDALGFRRMVFGFRVRGLGA